jgi:5,10-methylenetetrahydrofolate reductase
MSKLKQALQDGKFVISGEIGPPKGVDIEQCLKDAEILRDRVVAFNVTDMHSAVMLIGSMVVSAKLLERGMEPIFHITCRDRNRLALQSDLLSAWVFGIENVLCLTGDHLSLGDHAQAKPVYDIDSVQLIKAAATLNSGYDMAGHELTGKPDFFLGAVVSPAAEPLELQIIKMKKKVAVGARFFQTQAVFDPERFKEFIDQVQNFNVPIIAGIVVLKSAANARYMNNNVSGIKVPDSLIKELEETKVEDRKKKAVEITARIIREVKPYCQGIHIMTMGWEDLVPDIIEQSELS